ncbi:hypothetical protein BD626DRAFT_575576 [Schizophyllum amplum]|uniref:NADH pyrophosphatase-like N-terminal domain-containing protein n=1 Tax=Schizophyllum amplum TaxID=97359 RepID=A0A550BVJ8_9AGAR|nr:hypothetical protein BD626DRAFT_575576 [Auriculariopsis ampla]
MAETHINLFGGSPLNRLSWLRPSQIFLNAASSLPSTRWVLFKSGQPLVSAPRDAPSNIRLAYFSTSDVEPFIGDRPWFAQSQDGSALIPAADANHHTEGARHRGPPLVFLGLEETDAQSGNALPSTDFTDPSTALSKLHGTPYFALDVGDLALPHEQLTATETDHWNAWNKFCPGCRSPRLHPPSSLRPLSPSSLPGKRGLGGDDKDEGEGDKSEGAGDCEDGEGGKAEGGDGEGEDGEGEGGKGEDGEGEDGEGEGGEGTSEGEDCTSVPSQTPVTLTLDLSPSHICPLAYTGVALDLFPLDLSPSHICPLAYTGVALDLFPLAHPSRTRRPRRTRSPIDEHSAPDEYDAPVENTPPPPRNTSPPSCIPPPPPRNTAPPTNASHLCPEHAAPDEHDALGDEHAALIENTTSPSIKQVAPVEGQGAPFEVTRRPHRERIVPVDERGAPVDEHVAPIENTAPPLRP